MPTVLYKRDVFYGSESPKVWALTRLVSINPLILRNVRPFSHACSNLAASPAHVFATFPEPNVPDPFLTSLGAHCANVQRSKCWAWQVNVLSQVWNKDVSLPPNLNFALRNWPTLVQFQHPNGLLSWRAKKSSICCGCVPESNQYQSVIYWWNCRDPRAKRQMHPDVMSQHVLICVLVGCIISNLKDSPGSREQNIAKSDSNKSKRALIHIDTIMNHWIIWITVRILSLAAWLGMDILCHFVYYVTVCIYGQDCSKAARSRCMSIPALPCQWSRARTPSHAKPYCIWVRSRLVVWKPSLLLMACAGLSPLPWVPSAPNHELHTDSYLNLPALTCECS